MDKSLFERMGGTYHQEGEAYYGSTVVAENIAESVAQVEAMGKGASREAKQVYKRMWREMNPDAAYWEYMLKKDKKKYNNPNSRYFQERQRQAALKAAKK